MTSNIRILIQIQFLIAALLAVAAAAPSSYPATYSSGYHAPAIAITSESDVRNLDGSSHWR